MSQLSFCQQAFSDGVDELQVENKLNTECLELEMLITLLGIDVCPVAFDVHVRPSISYQVGLGFRFISVVFVDCQVSVPNQIK